MTKYALYRLKYSDQINSVIIDDTGRIKGMRLSEEQKEALETIQIDTSFDHIMYVSRHGCYMYGPCNSIARVVKEIINEWQDDKHLVA